MCDTVLEVVVPNRNLAGEGLLLLIEPEPGGRCDHPCRARAEQRRSRWRGVPGVVDDEGAHEQPDLRLRMVRPGQRDGPAYGPELGPDVEEDPAQRVGRRRD